MKYAFIDSQVEATFISSRAIVAESPTSSGGPYRAGGVREVEYTLEKHGSKWQITETKPKIMT